MGKLKIEAHDRSRIEWSIYVPLPERREGEAQVELLLEVPENVHAPHDGWEQLQVLARLSSPEDGGGSEAATSADQLRRATLGVARKLKLLREALPRVRVVHALHPMPVEPALARELEGLLDRADLALREARATLTSPRPFDPAGVVRERALADEFLSGQLLELLTVAEETCARMVDSSARRLEGYRAVSLRLRNRISRDLAAELAERARRGYCQPEEGDVEGLAGFLDRAALLKKHFQEVLFLEPEVAMVDQQSRDLVALAGAATAFVGYFALQALQSNAAARAGLGVGTVLTLGAFAYALKDRMKELTRQWLAGKLSHLYANRVLTLRAPSRLAAARPVVLQARESFTQTRETRPDPLNPAEGATRRIVAVRYRQRTRVKKRSDAALAGFQRAKLVFRYDLSPLLTRLDDSVKRVPVPGFGPSPVRFADAPRIYRVALRLRVRTDEGVEERAALVLLQRTGICGMAALPEPGEPGSDDAQPAVALAP
ncbi:MAG: hypothetical protein NVSMB23_29760 [Myxococcales bacterium]